MTSKGKQYSTIVRRAGLAWGKGDLQKAIIVLEEGIAFATQNGDAEVARVLQRDLDTSVLPRGPFGPLRRARGRKWTCRADCPLAPAAWRWSRRWWGSRGWHRWRESSRALRCTCVL